MRIAILGGGQMGEALAVGLGHLQPAPSILIAERSAERAAALEARGFAVVPAADEAVRGAEAVIVVVKPQDVRSVLTDIAGTIDAGALVLSIAAGIPTGVVEAVLPRVRVVRAMPNTPARIGAGVTGISAGVSCDDKGLELARRLMGAVGTVIAVPEALQDAVTATSGSGPAYLFLLAEAMLDAARALGLEDADARAAVTGTLLGAAQLLADSAEEPAALRAAVTSPNGTTAAAIAVLEERGLRDAVGSALIAARDRSRELASS